MKPEKKITAVEIYALVFGLFLGLAIWKFGNPVILDHKIFTPSTLGEFWSEAWPTHWANWVFSAARARRRDFRHQKQTPLVGFALVVVAAAAVVRLADFFRHPDRG